MPGSCVHPRAPIRKAVGVCVSLLLAALACTSTPDRPVRRSGMWRCRPGRQRRRPSAEDDEAFPVQRSLRAIGVRARVEFFRAPGSSVSAKVGSRRTSRQRTNGSPMPPNGTQFFSPLYASEAIDPSCCNSTLVGASADRLRALGMIRYLSSVDDRIDACQTATGVDQTRCRAHLDQFMMERVVPVVPILLPGMQTPSWTRVLRASIDPVDGGAGARSGRAGSGRRLTRLPGR
jgi:hypothetical protein